MRLFIERGYESVGIREIAAEADVAVTTLFSHFPSKETLVFEQAPDFHGRLRAAILERHDGVSARDALHREIADLVRHCTSDDASGVWHMIEGDKDLSAYAQLLEVQLAQTLTDAIDEAPDLAMPHVSSQTVARFALAAFTIARSSDRPQSALDESFRMVEAAWDAAPT